MSDQSNANAVPERYAVQHPTVTPDPAYAPPSDENCCGNCPGWQRNRTLPFGQCLPAIKAFGAAMYTPELAGCTLPMDVKAKGAGR